MLCNGQQTVNGKQLVRSLHAQLLYVDSSEPHQYILLLALTSPDRKLNRSPQDAQPHH
jgi:hypothetical protein